MAHFTSIDVPAEDAAFGLMREAQADKHPQTVALSAGLYRDEQGLPWVLPVVKKVKDHLHADRAQNHEYLPVRGYPEFLRGARKLLFGASNISSSTLASVQTIAGTGSNHIGALLLAQTLRPKHVWFPDPTWANHPLIWTRADGKIIQKNYPYFNATTNGLDLDGMIETLQRESSPGDVVLLHACAHNPTGVDPTREQWKVIANHCVKLKLFPLFDSAYHGFASGDLEQDGWAMKHFFDKEDLEMAVAQSFSKNFGLYAERVGALHVKTSSSDAAVKVGNLLEQLSRSEITCPPAFGARIVAKVLNDEALFEEWKRDLVTMSSRIAEMRKALHDELIRLRTPGRWEHILTQIGMFSYVGVTEEQALLLKNDYHIYLLYTGRVAITGLTRRNVKYVADSIDKVVRKTRV